MGFSTCRSARRPAARGGLTLLEVILALAILGMALVVMGELLRIGARSAEAARDLTMAQIMCDSTLAEVTAGIIPAESIGPTPIEMDPEWLYSISVEPTGQTGLIAVRVTVDKATASLLRPVSFSIVRWMPDPMYVLPEETETAAGSSGSTTTSQGAGSG
jgi:type II secretion system protein I